MSYIYFGDASSYTTLADNTQNSINEIAPNYFTLDTSGQLVIKNTASRSFVDDMHTRGIRVAPYLTNDWNRQSGGLALNNRTTLAAALVQAVDTYGLDGVNIDLENLTPAQRDDYVEFVRQLRDLLPNNKTIAVAVSANPYGDMTGWYGSFDYAGLAKYCDYLMIMTYDEHYDGSFPGPVASASFVERSITYARSQVSSDKLVLGIPFYGRIWGDNNTYPQGYGISHYKIDKLIADYNGSVRIDPISKSACATITIKTTDSKPVIGGKALTAGSYTIWFDNEETIKTKLKLVDTYNLKGTGSWSLGQENNNTWDYYKLWLNGCTFMDIQSSWAKQYILDAYMKSLITGMSADIFAPDAPLTRAEAATMLVRMLGYTLEADDSKGFDDTNGNWAEAYINTARQHHLISGIGNNQFAPDRVISRQEIAVMLNNILQYTPDAQLAGYDDVSTSGNSWSYSAIAALSQKGIITGYTDGSFRPLANVSRAEITALMMRIQTT